MFALQLTVMHRFSTAIHMRNHYMYIQISRNSYDNGGSATQDRFETENIFRGGIRAKSSSFEVRKCAIWSCMRETKCIKCTRTNPRV